MMNKWITINNKNRFSQLRRVGDLQSYGIPLVSLFYDIKEKLLYLALSVYKRENTSSILFIVVNKMDIISYMNEEIGLRDFILQYKYDICFLMNKKVSNGQIIWYKSDSIPSEIIPDEEEFFEEEFCYDKSRIKKFLSDTSFEINNISN